MQDESDISCTLDPNDIFREILNNMMAYHPSDDFGIVERAYGYASHAHREQRRASGEPYIVHPLEVARICTSIELDRETIAAAILHDVIEDTELTFEDVERDFGNEIALIVDGVTKLDKVPYTAGTREPWQLEEDLQADNYRKMFLAMSHDIRVVIIKIADRLHNLRTIKHMPAAHKKKKADETLFIYAPLAHRLGIAKLRYELEDLAFRYQNPDAYAELKEKIQYKLNERQDYVKELVSGIAEKLEEAGLKAEVKGRPKHFFSIFKKMMQKEKTLDQIYDLFAVRVVVENITDCYHALGVIHVMYTPVPGRFKDYIAMPKPNMYQSIHNTMVGPGGEHFEIQIRTYEMNRTSEYGIAAHWKYKGGVKANNVDNDTKLNWLKQLMDWQRDLSESSEFLSGLRQDLSPYKDKVYCFTPKGMVVELVNGATPIDFAYAIHSAVGNRMIGAKVNNRIAPLGTVLQTGDRVEIITSQNSKGPSRDWLKMCKTTQSRTKINAWFKMQHREDNIQKGKELLEAGAKKKGVTLQELSAPAYVATVLRRYSLTDWDSLCSTVGYGGLSEGQVINRLYGEYLREHGDATKKDDDIIQLINEKESPKAKGKSSNGISVKGDNSMAVRFSQCCNPMPGDEIVGFVTRGKGVSIHRSDCVNIMNLEEVEQHRIVPVEWNLDENTDNQLYHVALNIYTESRTGVIVDISRLFMEEKINIESINSYKHKNDARIRVTFPISGKAHLDRIILKISGIKGIYEVARP